MTGSGSARGRSRDPVSCKKRTIAQEDRKTRLLCFFVQINSEIAREREASLSSVPGEHGLCRKAASFGDATMEELHGGWCLCLRLIRPFMYQRLEDDVQGIIQSDSRDETHLNLISSSTNRCARRTRFWLINANGRVSTMPLLSLPDELISNICEQVPENIPKLRLTCTQLQGASFHSFLTCFFTNITVLAHPASLSVLLEITKSPQFARAIRALTIDADGVFSSPFSESHQSLTDHGIIREQLTKALSRLPMCKTLITTEDSASHGLGRSLVEEFYFDQQSDDFYSCDKNSYWLSGAGFFYLSYISLDVIAAITSCKNAVEEVDLWSVELVAMIGYLETAQYADREALEVKEVSIGMVWDYKCDLDGGMASTIANSSSLGSLSDLLGILYRKFPRLQVLKADHHTSYTGATFPRELPSMLRVLCIEERSEASIHPKAIVQGLRGLINLEHIALIDIFLDDITQLQAVLHEISQLPSLTTIHLRAILQQHHGTNWGDPRFFCFEPCDDGVEHNYESQSAKTDLPGWIMDAHVCTCKNALEGSQESH